MSNSDEPVEAKTPEDDEQDADLKRKRRKQKHALEPVDHTEKPTPTGKPEVGKRAAALFVFVT